MPKERRTYDQEGTYDEIVRTDCTVHIERLNDKDWMLALSKPDGTGEVYGITGVIYDNYEMGPNDSDQSGWPTDPGGPVEPVHTEATSDE
ncbi:hypothetical protein [Nesterenkonia flava]|uniref:Uncharacterized protein n=1 Tax=Nesterenkonia flava TaxID=469799 RepID=A0ABU1FW93_9MICC|nr:hypothetical protein [Nesterenkonia flava]MDR5712949.1 hypothetical protein [Nesterenkonia flava]